MYTLFIDKSIVFECKIELDGASLRETVARLVVETPDRNLLFLGTVSKDGVCSIPVSKLHGLMEEKLTGNMKLEVIAEDTYFQPWESPFTVERSKKLFVEVKENKIETKPAMTVRVIPPNTPPTPYDKLSTEIVSDLRKNGITFKNILKQKSKALNIIQEHVTFSSSKPSASLVSDIIKLLVTKE